MREIFQQTQRQTQKGAKWPPDIVQKADEEAKLRHYRRVLNQAQVDENSPTH